MRLSQIIAIWIALVLASDQQQLQFTGKLSSLKVPAKTLGEGWTGPTGLVVDDVNDLSAFKGDELKIVEGMVKQMKPQAHKIRGVADFTYMRKEGSLIPKSVTLRAFVFESTEAAKRWWKDRFHGPSWDKIYKPIEGIGDDAVDVIGQTKRAVLIGNLAFTSHQIVEGDSYLVVLNKYLEAAQKAAD